MLFTLVTQTHLTFCALNDCIHTDTARTYSVYSGPRGGVAA